MPHIFRLQSRRDGKFHIHGIFPKAGELSPLRLHHSPEVNFGVAPGKIQQTPSTNVDQKTTEASNDQAHESLHNHVLEQDYTRVGKDHDNLAGKDYDLPGKPVDFADITEKQNNSTLKKGTGVSSDREEMKGSFWEDMEILIDSPRGSLSVTQSRTREELAENLLKEGPFVLRSLSNTDLLHLVDLLISDKKWIEEYPSQASPFKITKAAGKSPSLGHSHAANGLRLIFMRTPSQANLETVLELETKQQAKLRNLCSKPRVLWKKQKQ
ncbi:hypothetical protein J1N35_023169 [Gossypium stocksii]|uniref:OST-HTH associated domain-containing protein n=1 Tax=Gossypium stocksii TaxID=47602 RepID=A0A9D4A2X4_9ROSI|nr:hypothetical protein J1N35_023169 [Gossypium stocksii]